MCGIAGVIDISGNLKPELLHKMADVIKHRGPDDEGFFLDKEAGVGFAHRRLSIIDLKNGHQPMKCFDENYVITFNGEIYNYKELQVHLSNSGLKFNTDSDTEVILNIYKKFGIEGFNKLNGIFAFAIYDKLQKKVILARDTFGVKPLYYSLTTKSLTFASEIKAILQNRNYKPEFDYDAFGSYLTYRYNPSPQTLFKNIYKLKPGEFLEYKFNGEYKLNYFEQSVPKLNQNISEQDAVEEYSRLLSLAVKRQLTSDVPVGLFLSGGIDSAVLGYFMNENNYKGYNSYSVGFSGKGNYNELDDAKITSDYLKVYSTSVSINQNDYLNFFYKSFYYLEEPIAEATIPALYYLSSLASKDVKVVLAGQGADEPLAGYRRYYGESKMSRYQSILNMLPLKMISGIVPRNERLKRAAYASQFDSEIERFLAIYTIFTPEQKKMLLKEDVQSKIKNSDIELLEPLYTRTGNLKDSLSKILYIDTRMKLSDDLLLFGDKMTMANSLEMRVPYLDKELIGFLETLPSKYKLKGNKHKYIHKRAATKWLPKEIIDRKKRGFETPMDEWLQGSFADDAKKIFNEKNSASGNFFRLKYINELIDLHKEGKENYLRHIMALLSFELWHKTFFENNMTVN